MRFCGIANACTSNKSVRCWCCGMIWVAYKDEGEEVHHPARCENYAVHVLVRLHTRLKGLRAHENLKRTTPLVQYALTSVDGIYDQQVDCRVSPGIGRSKPDAGKEE